MVVLVPKYYNDFHCIADKCKHSCCIGWEIDIDELTYKEYMNHNGSLKDRFQKHICFDEVPHFILDDNERCPFLNDKNLCDIYAEMGESSLCQICTDHPRFRNYYSGITEVGLGLCCEEACRIILGYNELFTLNISEEYGEAELLTEEEKQLFDVRAEIISILQNKSQNMDKRFDSVWKYLGVSLKKFCLNDIFNGLEYMEHDVSLMISDEYHGCDDFLEQLAVYFVFRHLADSIDDGMLIERVVFAYIGVKAVSAMCKNNDFDEICENARIYSSEIEYSEDNVDEILFRVGDLIEILI